jgi:hypothetical protein
MGDDGKGGKISIPSVLISYEDGEILKKFLRIPRYSKHVQLELSFIKREKVDAVEFTLWSSSHT